LPELLSGVLMGMFQNNAGGAWDNAKKSFEKGVDINGKTYYKGSEPHKASVTGDTVGDPFKDTSGPSMNILIKLMSIVSLVIAPTLATLHKDKIEANRKAKIEALTGVSAVSAIRQDQQPCSTEIKGYVNESGDFVYDTGNIQEVELKGGKRIKIGEGSQLYQMYNSVKKKIRSFRSE
jgi:K(+)-stimulated pyrophosphate-energized sodium pump